MSMENRLGLGFVRQPKTVLFGPGQRRQLGLMAKGLGRRALVVTDERMATDLSNSKACWQTSPMKASRPRSTIRRFPICREATLSRRSRSSGTRASTSSSALAAAAAWTLQSRRGCARQWRRCARLLRRVPCSWPGAADHYRSDDRRNRRRSDEHRRHLRRRKTR